MIKYQVLRQFDPNGADPQCDFCLMRQHNEMKLVKTCIRDEIFGFIIHVLQYIFEYLSHLFILVQFCSYQLTELKEHLV